MTLRFAPRFASRAITLAMLLAAAQPWSRASAQSTAPRGATDAATPRQLGTRADYHPAADRVRPDFPAAWPYPAGRAPVSARRGMVVSEAPLSSRAGVEILKRGGNAVDAAVATAFALAVVYPEAGNIGGGGFMVIHLADGRNASIDFREVAPLAATRDMYVGPDGNVTSASVEGPLASGVPGAVAGLTEALRKYGTLPLRVVMAPAIRLAEQGFTVDSAFSATARTYKPLLEKFAGAALLLPNGKPIAPGTLLKQPALARTLRAIARQGRAGFYDGPIADAWTKELAAAGGIITTEDLRRYSAVWREPIRSTYRGFTFLGMPPASGGVTITETLNILEGYPRLPSFGGASWAHLVGSAFQRAFVDRNSKLGDPAFVNVPLKQLTDKTYAAKLRATILADRATPTATIPGALREGTETTHLSVADAKGNAVGLTTTLNNLFGSGVYLASAGFFLNDEMDDFAAKPGTPNMFGLVQGEANAIAPGKRMLSAMAPTIVLDRAGKLLLVAGSRGGPRIITSTAEVLLNVIDYRMTLADAMSAPRLHHQALPDTLRVETNGITSATADSLRAMGHSLFSRETVGRVNALMRVRGGYEGVADPRGSGSALGY
ncbi:MAG TPA: gamma-glutamyltransferase [Gemmatimonadaceae bacterium]|nr:gamma-glutamyltransferase [Gemmatimonadaceae bacterium]